MFLQLSLKEYRRLKMDYKPNIQTFECNHRKYFFDVNKNIMVNITDEEYDNIERYQNINELNESNSIKELIQKGFLSTYRPDIILHPCTIHLNDILNNNLNKICLQITQRCNFRCKYCAYSGTYNNRIHASKDMSLEIACKSIDFLIRHSSDSDELDIGFYGGEPLLKTELIKQCIKYAVNKTEGKKVTFSITTNGSYLDDEIGDFLAAYNVDLLVSLDGPENVQNRSRCFATGEGTFSTVYDNLTRLILRHPEYTEHVSINMVLDQRYDNQDVEDFIKRDPLMKKINLSATTIAADGIKEPMIEAEAFQMQREYGSFKYMLFMLKRMSKNNKELQLWKGQFTDILKYAESTKLNVSPLERCTHHGGPCIPGQLRLFVDYKGDFFPCERVSETTEAVKIGSLCKGFDIEKVDNLLNIGRLTEEECKNCFAIRNCTICAATIDDNGILSRKKKLEICEDVRYSFLEMLKDLSVLYRCGYKYEEDYYE